MPFSRRVRLGVVLACAVVAVHSVGFAQIDRAALRRELQDFSAAAIDRRLGPDYAFYHTNGVNEVFPEIWLAPTRQDPGGRPYQIGGPWTSDAGLYSSTQGQILYTPDE